MTSYLPSLFNQSSSGSAHPADPSQPGTSGAISAPNGANDACQCANLLLKMIADGISQSAGLPPGGDEHEYVDGDFSMVHRDQCAESDAWPELFERFFLAPLHCTSSKCAAHNDDMLWYVKHNAQFFLGTNCNPLEVYRRESKKQPILGDSSINWEESVYLNLILQQLEYTVTVAVCTKTSPSNLQILRKNSQRVFASPSRRRMDAKGESEEIAYPSIYFAVDDFERVFADVAVRDGECVCVELVAKLPSRRGAVFLGSIRYEVLKQVYDAKASKSWGAWGIQRLVTSAYPARRQEFVRMRGPHGKGYAEMAVAKVPGLGFETPLIESTYGGAGGAAGPGAGGTQFGFDEQQDWARQRRMSDTHLNRHVSYKSVRTGASGNGVAFGNPVKPCQSESDYMQQYPEVDANTLDDELDEGGLGRLWSVRGFGQAWHWLREKKRATSAPLNAYLTYVTLPWQHIVADLLQERVRQPVLTFELDPPVVNAGGGGRV